MAEVREPKVCLALVWHMHQPHYENPQTDELALPWVRLHGTKDYFDMAALAEPFGRVRFTINVVPSLIEQIDGYTTGRYGDRYLELSRRGPAKLDSAERRFVEENFFSANEATMISRYPRYSELHRRFKNRVRGRRTSLFSESELRDLIVLFNLCWIDPSFFADPELKRLATKGRNFTDEEMHLVLDRQLEILRSIVPLYRRLSEAGKIELSASPFYHPILPLLLDSDSAREALPGIRLPRARIQFPEDFDEQVKKALDQHEAVFGTRPAGMWPSEGAVSDAVVRRLAAHGVRWAASDEEVLYRSQLAGGDPDPCQAYLLGDSAEREVALIFRNKRLSDLIGFSYMNWNPNEAARDFVAQVMRAAGESPTAGGRAAATGKQGASGAPPLVAVILDGENCWEYYPEDGIFFLRELYGLLDQHPEIEMVTVGDYLRRYPPSRRIERLFAGSWIQHNFAIWIGHPEDNAAWDLLARTRTAVLAAAAGHPAGDPGVLAAQRHLAIAEGSDWFWWFGDDHTCAHVDVFDQLFRAHLAAAHQAVGLTAPVELAGAIKGRFGRPRADEQVPVRFITPRIDGRVTHFYEWKLAGRVDAALGGGAMHSGDGDLRVLHYGFDLTHLFVRLDVSDRLLKETQAAEKVVIEITQPRRMRIEIELKPGDGNPRAAGVLRFDGGAFHPETGVAICAVDQVVEVGVPFDVLGVKNADTVELAVLRVQDGRTVEALPARSPVVFRAPGNDFEDVMWSTS
jgi:alpha-amylase/alpha-mannosidase (GH57 family)